MKNGYYQVRFNLTKEQANASILRDCQKVYDQAIKDGKTLEEAEFLQREKCLELEDYWFTWVEIN